MLNTYQNTATESERESIAKNLQETEDWLYEDGDDESENAYIEKLNEIKKVTLLPRSFVYIKMTIIVLIDNFQFLSSSSILLKTGLKMEKSEHKHQKIF